MTRLVKEDLTNLDERLSAYDRLFERQTGKPLVNIAKKAAGLENEVPLRSAAVIPVTAGLGLITDFARSVAAILRYAGSEVTITKGSDVTGLKEAYEKGCEIAFLADDDTFLACGLGCCAYSDNGQATGYGYAQALLCAMENAGVQTFGARVLVLGAGPVGSAAAACLAKAGAVPWVYDKNPEKLSRLLEKEKSAVDASKDFSPENYLYIIDASTQGDFIKAEQVCENTIIAAPGMPWGPTEAARKKATVIYNPLELGTLTMYFQCLKGFKRQK